MEYAYSKWFFNLTLTPWKNDMVLIDRVCKEMKYPAFSMLWWFILTKIDANKICDKRESEPKEKIKEQHYRDNTVETKASIQEY